jgi:hypothetical protein
MFFNMEINMENYSESKIYKLDNKSIRTIIVKTYGNINLTQDRSIEEIEYKFRINSRKKIKEEEVDILSAFSEKDNELDIDACGISNIFHKYELTLDFFFKVPSFFEKNSIVTFGKGKDNIYNFCGKSFIECGASDVTITNTNYVFVSKSIGNVTIENCDKVDIEVLQEGNININDCKDINIIYYKKGSLEIKNSDNVTFYKDKRSPLAEYY